NRRARECGLDVGAVEHLQMVSQLQGESVVATVHLGVDYPGSTQMTAHQIAADDDPALHGRNQERAIKLRADYSEQRLSRRRNLREIPRRRCGQAISPEQDERN